MKRISERRICVNCGSDKTWVSKQGWPYWHKDNCNWYCNKCYDRLISNPKRNPRRMKFNDKQIALTRNPRKGVCTWCHKTDCITHIHHIEYHRKDPLKDTIELCASCHMKETNRIRRLQL